MADIKKIALLGCTGSIGQNTLKVIEEHSENFEVVALAARKISDKLIADILKFKPKYVAIASESDPNIKQIPKDINIFFGEEGLCKLAELPEVDIVVIAVLGLAGLKPAISAAKSKKRIALATKEVLVAAGKILMNCVKENGAELIPIDSEHSAIFQCMQATGYPLQQNNATKLILTASGGPFYNYTQEQLQKVTAQDALNHPTWLMGNKITIDSATLMNKGLEVIEARWLFDFKKEQIEVLIHPQSIIHSMVEFCDKSVMAQLAMPDMRIAIQYALTYPARLALNVSDLNFLELKTLSFAAPDLQKFPCLKLSYTALQAEGTMPVVLNAANEVCVAAFLNNKIGFYDIPKFIEEAMQKISVVQNPSLDDIINIDKLTKEFVTKLIKF